MGNKGISREEKEHQILDLYYNQNKTYRQITAIVGTYPREIKSILKKADPSRSQSIHSQAYHLFSEGKSILQVAIALDIRQPLASELFIEYWQLSQQDQLYRIFQEIKGNIHFFLGLYRQAIAARMNIRDVIRVLEIAKNDLRSIEYRCQELNRQANFLAASNRNAVNSFQDFSNQISEMRKRVEQYKSLCEERKQELEKISKFKNSLESYITNIRNNSEEYSQIKETIKREMANTISDSRQIIMLAYRSLIESARKDISKFYALIYNSPTVITSPDYAINEDVYERILLNEVEELYDKMVKDLLDKTIGDSTNKNEMSLKLEAERDHITNDPASFTAYIYKREEKHTFIR